MLGKVSLRLFTKGAVLEPSSKYAISDVFERHQISVVRAQTGGDS
jgi:hypothetical protein